MRIGPSCRKTGWLALLGLLIATPIRAQDGSLVWETIDTPHFQLHFPRELDSLAFRAAHICEEAHAALVPIFGHRPTQRTQVVLSDFGDSANGSATALPYLRIRLFAAPPALDGNLNNYDDWLRLLIYHEYVHVLHLDTIDGLPDLLNRIMGKTFAPNQNMPAFHLEGAAVWLESATSGRGRVQSALFRGYLRMQAITGRLFDVDEVTHMPLDWPGGNVWYLYGGHFYDWVMRTRGQGVASRVNHRIADDLIPFGLNRATAAVTGQTLTALWRAWQADLVAQAHVVQRDVAAQGGPTPLTVLTQGGRRHSRPKFLPDGSLLAIESDGDSAYALYVRDLRYPDARQSVLTLEGTGHFDVCPDGRTLIFDNVESYRGAYAFNDLYALDLQTRQIRRLTRGARVREPACSPDGRWVAAVRAVAGRTQLVRVELASGEIIPLADPDGINQFAFPTVSPDGAGVVALRVSQPLGRDLVELRLADRTLRRLTNDDAIEIHPHFSPDGRWLLYSSDRSGVFDIYARAWPGGETRRITRVLGGAVDPAVSPDGNKVVVSYIDADGFELAALDFEPDLAPPVSTPTGRPAADQSRGSIRASRAKATAGPFPTRPYDPFETLWPVAWSPMYSLSSPDDSMTQLGLTVQGGDAAGHHIILGEIATQPETQSLSGSAAYVLTQLTPSVGFSVTRATRVQPNRLFSDGEYLDYREQVTGGNASVSLPLSGAGHSASFTLRYGLSAYASAENPDPVYDPFDVGRSAPADARSAVMSMRVSYRNTDAFARSISKESGRTVSATLRVHHPKLGGDYEASELFLSYQEYVSLWWRHVLALRLSTSHGKGLDVRRFSYSFAPAPTRDILLDALDEIAFADSYLRGYPAGVQRGDRSVLAKLEYRVPLWDLFRGPSMVPVFMRRMKLALFTDWAQASNAPLELDPDAFSRSVGIELVAEATLGWRVPFNARIGWAHGLDEAGEQQFYLYLGSWF